MTPNTIQVDVECTYEYHPAAALFLGPPRCPRPKFHLHLDSFCVSLSEKGNGRMPRKGGSERTIMWTPWKMCLQVCAGSVKAAIVALLHTLSAGHGQHNSNLAGSHPEGRILAEITFGPSRRRPVRPLTGRCLPPVPAIGSDNSIHNAVHPDEQPLNLSKKGRSDAGRTALHT